jgi:undecaprenyl diphosphate synthase
VSDKADNTVAAADERVPVHVAVIMDGNGRWARARGMPRQAGHRAGVRSVRETVETAAKRGVRYLTLFAFSSENWRRPPDEVSSLMSLFIEALQREVDDLHRNNVRLTFIGAREQLQKDLVKRIAAAEAQTADNDGLVLTIAAAFGGRWDITEAARSLASQVAEGSLTPDDIDEDKLSAELSLGGLPDPDLLIRTGGEYRVSNFLLWNLAYSEMWFTNCLWPDFREAEFDEAVAYFSKRQRRFGYTGDQVA